MKSILISLFAIIVSINVFSQSLSPEVVASSGGYYDNGTVSLSWTLGECAIETYQAGNNILTQGFHQTKLTITEIDKAEDEDFNFLVYPNPTNNFIYLESRGLDNNILFVELFDLNGKKILDKKIENNIETIDMSTYSSAHYILKLVDNTGRKINSYKILKQN